MKEMENNLWFYCKFPKCSQIYRDQGQVLEHVQKAHSKSKVDHDISDHVDFGTIRTVPCVVPLKNMTINEVEKYCSHRKMLSQRGKIAALSRKKKPISRHFSPRPFRCKICPSKAFSLKSSLNNHMLTHSSSAIEHSCTLCGKSFRLISMLNAHKLTHLKVSLSCRFCNRNFRNKYRLAHHLKGLNEAEELACSVPECTMTFKNRSCMLFHHKMNHLPNSSILKDKIRSPRIRKSGSVKFTCGECTKNFIYEFQYKKHLKRTNLDGFEGECQLCSLKFTNRACQMHHNRSKHPTFSVIEKDELLEEIKSQSITKTGTYKCKFCELFFKNFDQLKSHMKTHPQGNVYKCNICSKSYKSLWNLKYHRMTHSGIKKFICRAAGCGKYFQNPRTLAAHKNIHLGSKFSCSECLKNFSLRIQLVKHMKNVSSDKIVKCTELNCSEQFKSKFCLRYHLKSIHGIDGLKKIRQIKVKKDKKPEGPRMRYCRYCAKDCVYEKRLELHEYIHTGQKPFKCDFESCTKAFRIPSSLLDHKRTHSEAKTFKCEICSKSFKTKNVYHAHKQIHRLNRKRKFACQFCSKGYFNNDCLQKHLKGMNEAIEIPCEICNIVFFNQNCKIHHFKSTHLEAKESFIGDNIVITKNSSKISCKFCGRICKYMSQITRHQTEPGNFNCNYCSFSFPYKHCMIFHKKNVHQEMSVINVEEKDKRKRIEVNKTCEICEPSKTFKFAHLLRTHMLNHTGERPFVCLAQNCSKDFKTAAALKEHRTIHTQEKNYKCKFCDKWFRLSSVRSNHMKNVHKSKRKKFPYSSKNSKSKRGKYQRKPKIVTKPKIDPEIETEPEFSILSNFPPSPELVTNPLVIIKEESNHYDEIELESDPFGNLNDDDDINIPANVKVEIEICDICQSCFVNKKFLDEHMVKFHPEILSKLLSKNGKKEKSKLECNFCLKKFSNRGNLNKHRSLHH